MKKYETMVIIRPDLSDEDKKNVCNQINDAVTKHNGTIASGAIWAERKRMCFPIAKHQDGTYYLLNFSSPTDAITKIRQIYKLNENILRVLFTALD
jgi:small subunit ribosomal protein S6